MATKKSTKKAAKRPSRDSGRSANSGAFTVRFRDSSPAWETNLENNLVEEGFSRSKARELVKLAAS
jgi:hypothetical protein